MKILGIAGSLRSGSVNAQLLQLAAETLPDGVELAVWEGLREIPPFDQDTEETPVGRGRGVPLGRRRAPTRC